MIGIIKDFGINWVVECEEYNDGGLFNTALGDFVGGDGVSKFVKKQIPIIKDSQNPYFFNGKEVDFEIQNGLAIITNWFPKQPVTPVQRLINKILRFKEKECLEINDKDFIDNLLSFLEVDVILYIEKQDMKSIYKDASNHSMLGGGNWDEYYNKKFGTKDGLQGLTKEELDSYWISKFKESNTPNNTIEWLKKYKPLTKNSKPIGMSVRLYNALSLYGKFFPTIDDITYEKISSYRNFGPACWKEFVKLRDNK